MHLRVLERLSEAYSRLGSNPDAHGLPPPVPITFSCSSYPDIVSITLPPLPSRRSMMRLADSAALNRPFEISQKEVTSVRSALANLAKQERIWLRKLAMRVFALG